MSGRLEIAGKALERPLCNHCLGRLFATVSTGLSNAQRGAIVRFTSAGISPLPRDRDCAVCGSLFSEVQKFAKLGVSASEPYEHSNFLVGTKIDPEVIEAEEQLWIDLDARETESIRSEMNREIGKVIEALLEVPVEFAKPDIVLLVDTMFDRVMVDVAPLFAYGRYRKHSRTLPQTRWPCRECRGKGCPRCDGRGRMYESSVQDLIGPVVMRHAEGEVDFFHGMGREDVDALMLGNGRPFVIEIRRPRKRSLDHGAMEREINACAEGIVEVEGMRESSRSELRRIKSAAYPKTYRVRVRFEADFEHRKLNDIVRILDEKPICQLTPHRVAHRRANLERTRTVHRMEIESIEAREVVFVVEAESGTYIKELMHGDDGRTRPSVAEIVGVACEVTELDVIHIEDKGA
ncbi:MAG: tRNA pseudouridine(54/55) synthase Pus10 [Methanobacteriota archaeon]|nr:MAG: tRNA pseudouridine(54/55) synthase Pus10 [Euryarchaeota archaeon]